MGIKSYLSKKYNKLDSKLGGILPGGVPKKSSSAGDSSNIYSGGGSVSAAPSTPSQTGTNLNPANKSSSSSGKSINLNPNNDFGFIDLKNDPALYDTLNKEQEKIVQALADAEQKKIKDIYDRNGNVVGYEYNQMSIANTEALQKEYNKKINEEYSKKIAEELAIVRAKEEARKAATLAGKFNTFTQRAMRAQENIEAEVYKSSANKVAEAIRKKDYASLIYNVPATTLKGLGVTASGALLEASVGTINDIVQLTYGGAGKALLAGLLAGDIKVGDAVSNSWVSYKNYWKQNPSTAYGRTLGAIFDMGEIASIAGKSGKIARLAKLKIAEKVVKKAGRKLDNVLNVNLGWLRQIGDEKTIRNVLTDSEINKYLSGYLTKIEYDDLSRKVLTLKDFELPVPKKIPTKVIDNLRAYKTALQEAKKQYIKVDYAKLRKISKKVQTPYNFELKGTARFSKKKIQDIKTRKVLTDNLGQKTIKKLPKGDVTIKELKQFEGAVFTGKKNGFNESIVVDKNGWTKGVKDFKDKYKIEYVVQPNGKATFKYYQRVRGGDGRTMLSPLFSRGKSGNYKLVGTVVDYVNPKGLNVSRISDRLFKPKLSKSVGKAETLNLYGSAAAIRRTYGKVGDYRLVMKQTEKRTVKQLISPAELRTTSRFRGYTDLGKKFRRSEFEIQYLRAKLSKNGFTNGQLADLVKNEIKSFVDGNASGIVKVRREVFTPVITNLQKNIVDIKYKLKALNGRKSFAEKFNDLSKRLSNYQEATRRFNLGMNKRGMVPFNPKNGIDSFDPLGALELKGYLNRKIDFSNPKFEFTDPTLRSLMGLDVQLPTLKLTGVGRDYLNFLARRTLLLRKSIEILKSRGISVTKLIPRVQQINRQISRQKQNQKSKQTTVQRTKMVSVSRNVNNNVRLRLPKIIVPETIRIPDLSYKKSSKLQSGKVNGGAYKIEVLRGKRYVRIDNKLYAEKDARNKLAFILDRDKSRTARIVNVGRGKTSPLRRQEVNYLSKNRNKFREYRILNKKKTNVSSIRLIEKRKFFNDLERLRKKKR